MTVDLLRARQDWAALGLIWRARLMIRPAAAWEFYVNFGLAALGASVDAVEIGCPS